MTTMERQAYVLVPRSYDPQPTAQTSAMITKVRVRSTQTKAVIPRSVAATDLPPTPDRPESDDVDDHAVGPFIYLYCGPEIAIHSSNGCTCYKDNVGNEGATELGGA